MTDLEQAVFMAIARNTPNKQPAAVLEAIQETHRLVPLAEVAAPDATGVRERVIRALNTTSLTVVDEDGLYLFNREGLADAVLAAVSGEGGA